jgi:hypothetical protein
MTDRELLELAAKAAGMEVYGVRTNPLESCVGLVTEEHENWNPLTDDGDALRLAVKTGQDINRYLSSGQTSACLFSIGIRHRCIENVGTDPYAATRRAIVRAAAEIGKEMK